MKKNYHKVRRELITNALPKVRALVKQYDLSSVNSAVKAIYEEKKAEKTLREAEAKVAALKSKLGR
jgi:hypothetical protein